MRGFAALVLHEINERRALLAAAAVASLLPLLAPLLPSTGSNPAEDIREAVMWVMVAGLVPLFALLLGVSFIGRDLAEDRLGFYYAQPISGATIWFGKLTAVVFLVWAVEALVMLPTVLLASDPARILLLPGFLDPFDPKWIAPALYVGAGVAIVLVAHAVGIVWRARSAWLVVDAVALLVVIAVAWFAVRPLVLSMAVEIVEISNAWMFGSLLVGLTVAGAIQATAGRVDPRRCHRVLSSTLWIVLILATTALFSWSSWIRSAAVDDLDRIDVDATGPGAWIAVSGSSNGRFDFHPRFIVNVLDQREVSIGPAARWSRDEVQFSDDGTTAVWVEIDGVLSWTIMTADLTTEQPIPRPIGITLDDGWRDIALSSNGSRLAVLDRRTLAVYQGHPAEQLTAVRIDDSVVPYAVRFDNPDSVRVLVSSREFGPGTDPRYWLLWLDVDTRRLTDKVEIDSTWWWTGRSRDGAANHPLALVVEGDRRHVAIRDPMTGEIIRDLDVRSLWKVRMLDDGRILVIRNRDEDDRAELVRMNGETIWSIDLPDAGEIFDGALVAPDRLLLGLIDWQGEHPNRTAKHRTLVLDLADGSHHELSREHVPVLGRWGVSTTGGSWEAGSVAGRLLRDERGSLFLVEPNTGGIRPVVPSPD